MAVDFLMDIYGLTPMGKKIKIGHAKESVDTCHLVGGTIFYIDDTADGSYQFYDKYGEPITPTVGSKPYAYEVITQGTKDKYYVFHDEMFTSKRWTYYSNGAYVYNSLNVADGIGRGKTNTATVMSADGGAYVTADSDGVPTIWYQLKLSRDAKVGGCNDWFIPSKAEIEKLRDAIGFRTGASEQTVPTGSVTGGTIAGTADGQIHSKLYNGTYTCYPSSTKFLNNYIWSSSESSAQFAWYWDYGYQYWAGTSESRYGVSVFFVRAF